MEYRIPFNKVNATLAWGTRISAMPWVPLGAHFSSGGPYTSACEHFLEKALGVPRVMLTTSGTAALEMAALLLDIGPGDEVIVPSFTFPSTANAFALRGATIRFADIRPDTLCMDVKSVDLWTLDRTRLVVPVHYAGVACTAQGAVEDNAHGLFGCWRGKPLGTFGRLAALSFHETKNFTMGEGGALVINDASLIERAEMIRDKGTDRSRYLRGEVDKYTWRSLGSSYGPSDILAAFLLAQLENRTDIMARRRAIWERYDRELEEWSFDYQVARPVIPSDCQQSYHMYYLILPTPLARAHLIEHLKSRGILAATHYIPLHLSPMGAKFGAKPGDCPVSEYVSDRLVRLPFFNSLSESDQGEVIEAVKGAEI